MIRKLSDKNNLNACDSRINLFLYVSIFGFFILFLRLVYIQIILHKDLEAEALDQHWALQDIPAKRGSIITSDGYTLAGTQTHYLLYAEPKTIQDREAVVKALTANLSEYRKDVKLEISLEEYFETKINRALSQDLLWVALEHNITPSQKVELENLNIKGLGFVEEPVRYYPEGSMASHVLGFVASDERGEKKGYFGIEGKLDQELKGKPGKILQEKDALGLPILTGGYEKSSSIAGRDIVLTLNRSIQYMVEKRLKESVEKYDAVSGTVIVMDPFSGNILAMANYPNYMPDDFLSHEEVLEDSPHRKNIEKRNLAISDTYEPGSVIKPITVSTALDKGLVTPLSTFNDEGPVKYSDYVIDNWDGKHHGVQNIIQLLQKSNNIGAAWVGSLVGAKDLYDSFKKFGLDEKTGIELEGEDSGVFRDPKIWTDIDIATVAFGQGMSSTPLQVLNAFNVVANGGYLVQPRIVHKILDGDKEIVTSVKQIRQVISEQTSVQMIDLLTQAAEGGEAKYFVLKNYKVAGKTGTAQIPFEGKYDPTKTNATFVGFLPTSKKFSMLVKLQEPRASIYAAETAAPLWMSIASDLINYYGLPPDSTQ